MTRFLERWSRLKRGEASTAAPAAPVEPVAAPVQGSTAAAAPAADAAASASPAEAVLPPIDSLDLTADFSAFMKKEVSESLRRAALRKLFSDPHFHFERMDKLDIYIDDYSGSDPIPADMLQKLRQFETLLKDEEEGAVLPASPHGVTDAAAGPSPAAAAPARAEGDDGEKGDASAPPSAGTAMPEQGA